MNLKKLFAGLTAIAVVAGFALATPSANGQLINDPEFDAALDWAYNEGLTRYNTQADFNPYGTLTREQFAKFASVYGATNLCLPADMDASCTFSDVAQADYTLVSSVELACQMGLVKGYDGMYGYTDPVTKAEVLTVLSRAISAAAGETAPSETMTPWYRGHFEAMRALGITNETDAAAVNVEVSRYEVGLMLYRARVDDAVCGDDAVDIGDILGDLFDDADDDDTDTDTDTGTDADDDDDDLDVPTSSNGTVMASLSPTTPNGATVPRGVSLNAASFDFTADDDDVQLESLVLRRFGLGQRESIDDVTVAVNGEVVSKSRNFNSSDREVRLTLNPGVEIEAGETVTIDVVVKTGLGSNVTGQQFQIGLVDFETNGTSDTSNLPERANTFEIGGVDGAKVIVQPGSSVNDVELGDTQVEVAEFEVDSEDDDVYITSVSLDDDEGNADDNLRNFTLEADGQVIATTTNTNDDLLTFDFSNDPFEILEGETVTFEVFADVVDGAGESINFIIDEDIYVRGYDDNYGYGIAVDTTGYDGEDVPTGSQNFDINAGELTLVEWDLESDEIREDQDDVVLAGFDININAGQDLSLEEIEFTVSSDDDFSTGNNTLLDHFEDIELIVWVDGSRRTYDLNTDNGNGTNTDSFTAGDDDLAIFLPNGADISVTLQADTRNDFDSYDIGKSFSASLAVGSGLEIIENNDDEEVTRIVPSSINFDTLEFVESSVEIFGINLTNVSVVKGTQNVDAVMFEVETDSVSSVSVEAFQFKGDFAVTNSGVTVFDENLIDALRLWKQTGSGWELMEQQSGFDITGEEITFDRFDDDVVPANSTQTYLLTVDVADNGDVPDTVFNVTLNGARIDDDDNNQLQSLTDSLTVDSVRDITVGDTGELQLFQENDSPVDRDLYVLGGTESTVAGFEVVAINEGVTIEDMRFNVSGDGSSDFATSVNEVVLYDEDMNELTRRNVNNSSFVNFNNVNLDIEEGSMTMYVAVNARRIGNNFNGVSTLDIDLELDILEAEGTQSNEDVSVSPVAHPYSFAVVPVHISGLAITNAYDTIGAQQLSNGFNELGVIEVTANTWNNVDPINGSSIDALLNTLGVEVSIGGTGTIDSVEFERRDITSSNRTCTANLSGGVYVVDTNDFGTNPCGNQFREIAAGVTAQYEVTVQLSNVGEGSSARLRMSDLTNGEYLEYTGEGYTGDVTVSDLRLGISNVQGSQKTYNN